MGSYKERRKRKPTPSAHQRQIRFFIGLFIVIFTLLTALIVWLIGRPHYIPH